MVAIPRLIEALGTARFGLLTLAWVVIGYFSLFDRSWLLGLLSLDLLYIVDGVLLILIILFEPLGLTGLGRRLVRRLRT